MRKLLSIICTGFVIMLLAPATALATTPVPSASPSASPAVCPVTQPNGNHPPDDHGPGGYGNDALWTNLAMWSRDGDVARVPGDAFHVRPDGTITNLKWAWYRYIPGKLTIEGHRLDAPAPPLSADIPAGYGNIGFQPVALTIPSAGCWEITGHVGEASLTFVMLFVIVPPFSKATPSSTP
jgi:hypothetical protein